MQTKKISAVILGLAAFYLTSMAVADLQLTPAAQPPEIDGALDDPCWREAAVIETLYNLEQPGQTSGEHKIMVAFDDQWLYAAYDIHQPESQRQPPSHLKHDDFVQRDDCVKLSFDPGTAGAVYYHFKLNRANARREQKVTRAKGQTKGRQDVEKWNIPWRSAVRDNPEGWTAELAVPLALLTPGGKLSKAGINLLATRYVVVTRDVAVNIATTERERLSAAPLEKSFDEPERFMPVKGMENLKVRSAFLPYIEKIRVSPYREADGKYFYDVAFDLKQFGQPAGKIKLEYEDRPADGNPRITAQTADLAGAPGATTMAMAIPADGFAARTGELRLYDAAAGELWQAEPLDESTMAALNTLFSAYLDRSYYTDEQHARVICAIGLPEASLKEMKLVCRAAADPRSSTDAHSAKLRAMADKPPAATEKSSPILAASGKNCKSTLSWWQQLFRRPAPDAGLCPEMELKIQLASIATGATPLTVQLRRADGTVMFDQTLELVKRPPNPGCEWKIDHENRMLLRNGRPFFLRGVNVPVGSIGNDIDAAMRNVSAMGFNALNYNDGYSKWREGSGLEPDNSDYLDLARRHNLLVMPWLESYGGQAPAGASYIDRSGGQGLVSLHFALIREERFADMTFAERTTFWEDAVARQMPRFLTAIQTVKNHPNLLGYFIFDEPVPKIKYDQITSGQNLYRKIQETDGYHPVMVNYCHLPEGEEYVNWCDVLAVDPYWAPPGQPNRVARFTAQAWRRAAPRRIPVWSVPCPEHWSFIYKRPIAPRENLCQTYLALIHGAKGLWFFTYPFKFKFTADGFKTVNRHLDALEPIVAVPAAHTVNDGAGNFNDIQAALFRHPDGGYVLLAANRCEYPVDAVFTLSNLGERDAIRQLFDENWSAVAQDASFQDQFEPFGVRAYTYQTARDTRHATHATDQGLPTRHATHATDQGLPATDQVTTITITITPHPDAVPPEPLIPVTGRPGKRNLVQNPGFELAPSLPGCPDYYPGSGSPGQGYYFGQPGALAGLDETHPFEGKYCLRLEVDPEKGVRHFNSLGFRLAPQKEKPLPFVFSVYMRADRDGATAHFLRTGSSFGDGKPVTLTTEWRRYYKVGEIGPGSAAAWQNAFAIWIRPPNPGEKCVAWIDGIQVEQGTEPAEYEP